MTAEGKWETISAFYYQLTKSKCLCAMESTLDDIRDVFEEVLRGRTKGAPYDEKEVYDLQLLALTIVKIIGETCVSGSSSMLCCQIFSIAEYLQDCSTFDVFMDNLQSENDQFVCRATLDALTSCLYLLHSEAFSSHIQKLLDLIKTCSLRIITSNLLNLFEIILYFSNKSSHVLESSSTSSNKKGTVCKNEVCSNFTPVEELKGICCLKIASTWPILLKHFFCDNVIANENQTFVAFLCMWKSIAETISQKNDIALTKIILNKESIIKHFVSSVPMKPASLKLFLGIMNMAFSAESLLRLTNEEELREFEATEILINTVNKGFLETVSIVRNSSGFIGAIVQSDKVESGYLKSKVDGKTYIFDEIAAKKLVLILLKAFSGAVVSQTLLLAFSRIEEFVVSELVSYTHIAAHSWLLELFLDQDDDLLQAMLSSLLLYQRLGSYMRDEDNHEWTKLKGSLNPHMIFIKFLKKLGYDHHILLEFLMSNETCILTYLVLYLKHVVLDFKGFTEAHYLLDSAMPYPFPLVEDMASSSLESPMENEINSVSETPINATDLPPEYLSQTVSLVTYSSSSSSDSHNSVWDDVACLSSTTYDFSHTIAVLKKLRLVIEKFMENNEFPYNAQPLLELLKRCEYRYST